MDLAEALTNANRIIDRQAAEIERIKAAMCRADGPAPDRTYYDAMAREIARSHTSHST